MGTFAPIRQDEYPATADLQCIAVHIPAGDEYKALLAGFIALLTDVRSYLDPESAQADGIAATFDEGYSQTNWDGCGVPPECEQMNTSEILFPPTSVVTQGNAQAIILNIGQRFATYFQQNTAAQFDTFHWQRFLAAGNYSYRLTGVKQSTCAIATFQVRPHPSGPAVLSTTHDFYNATTQFNQFFTGTFTIPADGNWDIVLAAATKNALSSSYVLPITCLELWKTS